MKVCLWCGVDKQKSKRVFCLNEAKRLGIRLAAMPGIETLRHQWVEAPKP